MSFGEHKKAYLLLGFICFVVFALVIRQLYLVNAITVKHDSTSVVSENTYALPYTKNDPSYGNPGAPVTIAIFSDLSCAQCRSVVNEVYDFITRHPRDVRLVWFDAPKSSLFFDRTLPHKAARCALMQDKFWPYVEQIFAVSGNYKADFLNETAVRLGLDKEAWSKCLVLKETADSVAVGTTLLDSFGMSSLPAIFINNKKITLIKGIDLTNILTQVIAPTQ